jgi:hypothetical protein
MLDTDFARPVGDVGNRASWPFPVLYHRVPGAAARRVVDGDPALLDAFVTGAETLVAQGAAALITSCGFLARFQRALAARIAVPLMTSSLLLLPTLAASLPPGQHCGVITYDKAALTPEHFRACGADPTTKIAGMPKHGALHGLIERSAPYDAAAIRAELHEAALALGDVAAIVLECTTLPPFAPDLRAATGRPVHDILTLGRLLHAGSLA